MDGMNVQVIGRIRLLCMVDSRTVKEKVAMQTPTEVLQLCLTHVQRVCCVAGGQVENSSDYNMHRQGNHGQ